MLTQEMAMTIQVLQQQGKSIKAIVRETGLARNTVRKYLREGLTQPHYQQTGHRGSKLDPFKDYLRARIKAAHPEWIPATVLYREILAMGYTGKVRILSGYVSAFKPRPVCEPVVRFETAPGQQMQVDFTVIRRGQQPLKAFVATLGYSRASYVRFFDNEQSPAWLAGLRGAFDYFGGVPREVLFDNPKPVMIERDAYGAGEHRWHAGLRALAGEYGFRPRACRPYRAKTKGKVERFNRYLKASFIVPLKATLRPSGLSLDVALANGYIGSWLETVANARVHATTGEVPAKRLVQERQALMPLPMCTSTAVLGGQTTQVPVPVESLQHPLSVYDAVLEGVG